MNANIGGGGLDRAFQKKIMEEEMGQFFKIANHSSEACFKRCVYKFYQEELDDTESLCLDRCLSKYSKFSFQVQLTLRKEAELKGEKLMGFQ